MATWRVFKDVTPPRHGELPDGEIAAWAEHEPIESQYDYVVDADEVGKVAGAGKYLLFKQGEYARPVEIEVAAITRYEEVEQPQPEPELAKVPEPGFSVAVTDEPE